jgi:CshA-type fibril repeat protein/VCBS repeat-containing protein
VGVPITIPSGALVVLQADGTVDYHPNGQFTHLRASETALDTFTYQISDGQGGTSLATVSVTINGINDSPDAINDQINVSEDGLATLDLRTNDLEPEGDTLTVNQINGITITPGNTVTLPSGASVTLNANGTVTYHPNDQFEIPAGSTATDTFTYRVTDGRGGFDTATVNVTVNGVNDAPVVRNDFSLGNTPGRPVQFDVTANDYDVDGAIDPTTVDLDPNSPGITQTLAVPGEGVWASNGQGVITFTPDPTLLGNPTPIQYSVMDNQGSSATASGSLSVTFANFDLWFGNDLSGSVDSSEFSQSRALISGMADILPFAEGNGVKAGLFSWADTGNAVLNQAITADSDRFVNTAMTYARPFNGGTNIDYAINFGVQQIQASLQAGQGGRAYADQVLLILTDASPDSQIIAPSASIIAAANAAKALGITVGFIAIQEAQSSQAALNVLSEAASKDPAGNPILMTAPTYAGINQAQIISVISGLAPQHAFNILNVPILAVGDQSIISENATVTLRPLDNDNHVSNDQLTLTEINHLPITPGNSVILASGAMVTMNLDGSITYNPNGQFNGLNAGEAQLDQFEYTVIDESGNTETGNIGITIEGINSVPPIVVDRDGDGVEFVAMADGLLLDVDGDGVAEKTAWASPDDAVLVYDANGNRSVDGVKEFSFASYSEDPDATDLEGLAYFDTNKDQTLDAGDAEFSSFSLWQDSDGDGQVGDGEMISLLEAGISSISLHSNQQSYLAASGDVFVHGHSQINYSDGSVGIAADAEFNYDEIILDDSTAFEVVTPDGTSISINQSLPGSSQSVTSEAVIMAPPILHVEDHELV